MELQNDFTLNARQISPITDPPIADATTVPHSVAGDGNGLTISYQVATAAAPDVNVVLDINNDITGISTGEMAGSITTNCSVTNAGTQTIAPSGTSGSGTFLVTQFSLTATATTSLLTTVNALLASITTNPNLTTAATVAELTQNSTSGAGTGAIFTLVAAAGGGPITSITVTNAGSGYADGDTITFTQAALAATAFTGASNDLVITLAAGDLFAPFTSVSGTRSGQGYALGDTVTFLALALAGAGFGVTVGNLVLTLQSSNLDVANPSWVETAASHTSGTGSAFVASKNSYRAARIRVKAGTAVFSVSTIRLMTDS